MSLSDFDKEGNKHLVDFAEKLQVAEMTRIFAVFLLLAVQVFSFTIPQQHAINPSSEVAKSWPGGDPFDDEPWPHYPWGPWPPGNGLIQK